MRASDTRGLSSPCSTDGITSPNGSPDTRITAFSPDDVRSKPRPESSASGPLSDPGLRKIYSVNTSDPFLVSTSSSNRIQLSPTAASFTPTALSDTADRDSQPRFVPSAFVSGAESTRASFIEQTVSDHEAFSPVHNSRKNNSTGVVLDKFDAERCSRALVIENVSANLTYMALAGFFNRREFTTLKGPVLTELSSLGKVYVAFTDSREAKKALEKIYLLRPEWSVFPLTAREYVQRLEPSLLPQTSDYEGQLLITVYYDSRNPSLNQQSMARSLETLTETFGDIKSFQLLPNGQENIGQFHLEFFNTRDAENVMTTLNRTSVDDCVLEVSYFKPDTEDYAFLSALSSPSPAKDEFTSRSEVSSNRNASWTPSRPNRLPYMELSPTGRSTVPPGEHADLMDWMSRAGENVMPSPRREMSQYSDLRVANQNAVDTERIRLGLDVRTTIMLRNIPNKIDQTMLKTIVDETSHGKYDFMYLRIARKDFANNCNVGYAFINFEDPIDIIDFVNMRAGRTWNCFNSDKVAEVSYATIQGKDCLVQKFRNSSVMLEHPSFRPKIFHTGTGSLAGTEDRFPGPDNPSKMRRSIENAEHVGLFAPRVGQQYRDEQRRRRSQYDRGTTAAEREIVYVRTLAPKYTSGLNSGLRSAPCTYPGMKIWYDPIAERGPRTS